MKREFLLEIGCEEIPAWMIPEACQSLRELLEAELKAGGVLADGGVRTFASPRRLVAYCSGLLPVEPESRSEAIGPPRTVAFDSGGKPTQAARSFAAKQGVRVESLKVVKTSKGEYVAAVKRARGRPTRQILAEALPRIIPAIRFPRSMYWTSRRGLRFIRPIRWLLALYSGQVVEFQLEAVRSGRTTWGHRILSGKRLTVRNFRDFVAKLRRAHVLVLPDERAQKIRREQQRLLSGRGLHFPSDEAEQFFGGAGSFDLLEYAINSAEHPSVILGEFSPGFLALPQEVLITVMVHHQKYFYLRDARGKLAAVFLAVVDKKAEGAGLVRRGHERVLAARFRDAEFFWQADRGTSLESRLPGLTGMVFAEGLGSYHDKSERLVKLVSWLGQSVSADGRRADMRALERGARLAKCDLSTQLVGEFPELQGIAGGLYAREQGEDNAVVRAIYDHYRPRRATDKSPATLEGALLALADKIDTVIGCFAAGLVPSGSSDPFGLRRAAQGAVMIILDHRLRFDLHEFLGQAAEALQGQALPARPKQQGRELLATVWEFLLERARYVFSGFAYDEINAVFAAGASDLVDVRARLEALHVLRPSPHFEPLSIACKRIRNILDQAGVRRIDSAIDPRLLESGAERELFEAFDRLRPQVAELRSRQQYGQALQLIASLRPQIDRFFDKVLVMANDEAIRKNRLALLAHIDQEFSAIADFAEIVLAQPPERGRRTRGR